MRVLTQHKRDFRTLSFPKTVYIVAQVDCGESQKLKTVSINEHAHLFSKGYFRSMTVIIDQNANTIFDDDPSTIMVTLTRASVSCLSAPFTKSPSSPPSF